MRNLYLTIMFGIVMAFSPYPLSDKRLYLCWLPMAIGYVWLIELLVIGLELIFYRGELYDQNNG